jgi:hypothetical protein
VLASNCNRKLRWGTTTLQIISSQKSKQDPDRTRPVAAFVAGGKTVSQQCVGNIYDGRYNRSRLLKPGPATIKTHVLCMDDSGGAAWFPVTEDQSYSRFPGHVETMSAEEVCAEAMAEAQSIGLHATSGTGMSVRGDMRSTQLHGWKSPRTAAFLFDQMTG